MAHRPDNEKPANLAPFVGVLLCAGQGAVLGAVFSGPFAGIGAFVGLSVGVLAGVFSYEYKVYKKKKQQAGSDADGQEGTGPGQEQNDVASEPAPGSSGGDAHQTAAEGSDESGGRRGKRAGQAKEEGRGSKRKRCG